MDSSIWGPSAWVFLHSVSFTYPENPSRTDKSRFKDFFEQLCYVLPCKDCCIHYQKELTDTGLEKAIESRDSLSRWLVTVHNNVNRRLGKHIIPYETVKKQYESYKGPLGGKRMEWNSMSWGRLFLYMSILTGSCYVTHRITKTLGKK